MKKSKWLMTGQLKGAIDGQSVFYCPPNKLPCGAPAENKEDPVDDYPPNKLPYFSVTAGFLG